MQAGDGPPSGPDSWPCRLGYWWKHNLPALSATFRVTAIDLPGFGSSHPDARLILDEVPAQVAALMGELGIERAHVIGHSMGGLVAGGLAADHPERVDRLVLVDAGFLSFDRMVRNRMTGPLRTLPWTSPTIMPTLLRDASRSGPVRMARATGELLRKDWRDKLPAITAPTLVIWGEHDRVCNPRIGEQIAAAVPDARLIVIRRAGHNPMWEKQADFDREVLAFLRPATGCGVIADQNRGAPRRSEVRMTISADRLTTEEILRLNRDYTFFSWSAQAKINPIVIDRAEGIYFWDPDGKRYIDFNSQLMSVNIGHGDRRVADAIAEQAQQARLRRPAVRDGGPRPAGRAAGGADAGRPEHVLLHPGRRRGQRERAAHGAHVHRPPEGDGALPLVPRRHRRGHQRHRRSAALGERAGGARRGPRPRPAALSAGESEPRGRRTSPTWTR